ncbi:MAG: acyltransferase family protein [Lachnospiraceae bacterium]
MNMKKNQLEYINGLKGIGAGIVYLCHFVFAFYYGIYSLEAADCHLPMNAEIRIGKSPLNILFSGNFAVRLFLVISGYVLCLRYFRTRDKNALAVSAAKRYVRLLPPILLTNTVIALCMYAGLYRHLDAAELICGSTDWLTGFNHFAPKLSEAVKEGLYGCFLFGSNQYNGVLWTIPYLFLGALLVYGCAWIFGTWKWRYVVYAVLSVLFLMTDYAGVFLGFVLCDVMHTQEKLIQWIRKKKLLLWAALIFGVYLSSYPSAGFDLEGTIYGILGVPRVVLFHLIGALLLVFGVLNLEPLQRFFGWKGFVRLGRISYSLYLIHFPVIAMFSCQFLIRFSGIIPYNLLMLLNFICTTVLVLVLSELSRKYIEPFSKKGERLIEQWIGKK